MAPGKCLLDQNDQTDLSVDEFIFFLVLLAIPLEVLDNLGFLLTRQEGVGPGPPTELKEALSLGPAPITTFT